MRTNLERLEGWGSSTFIRVGARALDVDPREHLYRKPWVFYLTNVRTTSIILTNDITGQALRELRVEDNGLKSLHLWRRYSDQKDQKFG